MAGQNELFREKPERCAAPVFSRATYTGPFMKRAVLSHGRSAISGRVPMSDCDVRKTLHHAKTNLKVEFIHPVRILSEAPNRISALQDEDRQRCTCADFFGDQQSTPSSADNYDIDGINGRHKLIPPSKCGIWFTSLA